MTVQLCDVAVIGSGFGGAIPAYYAAAAGARVTILERGPHLTGPQFQHSFQVKNVGRIVDIIQGDGLAVLAGNCVGGSSVVYFAASLRAPSFAFDRTAGTGRRLWPTVISRASLDPYYDRVETALPVSQPSWDDVTYAGGLFAAACHHTGHTANRVPVAVDLSQCTNCNWMLTGCRFDAKRSMLLNYLPAATTHGAKLMPLHEAQLITPALTPGYRYHIACTRLDPDDYNCVVGTAAVEAKILVVAAGAVGTPVLLQRSAPFIGGVPAAVGRHLSGNGDRVSVAVTNETEIAQQLDLHRTPDNPYDAHHIGKAINTATFDYLDAVRPEFERFTLQQLAFPALTNVLAEAPGWFGLTKKAMRQHWRSWLTVLAMTEDTGEGVFDTPPLAGSFTRLVNGIGQGTFAYHPSAHTRAGWAASDTALAQIFAGTGLATVRPWTEVPGGALTAHPLGSCRIGDDPATSALTPDHRLRGHSNIFVTDGAAVPAALTVNPSLTIAALAERASEHIVAALSAQGITAIAGDLPLPM